MKREATSLLFIFREEGELDENLIYEDFYDFLTNLYDLLGIEDEE